MGERMGEEERGDGEVQDIDVDFEESGGETDLEEQDGDGIDAVVLSIYDQIGWDHLLKKAVVIGAAAPVGTREATLVSGVQRCNVLHLIRVRDTIGNTIHATTLDD